MDVTADMGRKGSALLLALCLMAVCACKVQPVSQSPLSQGEGVGDTVPSELGGQAFRTGAEQLLSNGVLLRQLKGKRIAVVANHTAIVYRFLPNGLPDTSHAIHLVDTLRSLGLDIRKVFAPEHGFRGEAEAGAAIRDGRDRRTGLPVVSLYGTTKKPTPDMLADVDVVLFDIQDVGTRFYTYLSTLIYVAEACSEQQKALWLLDRPNPNGDRVGGPVLDTAHQRSFVGLHPIPILHGMTLGEYARMMTGEGWVPHMDMTVVLMKSWTHYTRWPQLNRPWIAPSPNLPSYASARNYPFLCWYEGTPVSVGRGTPTPFQVVGMPVAEPPVHPIIPFKAMALSNTSFTPRPIPGKADNPMHNGLLCRGYRVAFGGGNYVNAWDGAVLLLGNLYQHYNQQPDKHAPFFQPFFHRLAGTDKLAAQIQTGVPYQDIVLTWEPDLDRFKAIRAQYLLYPGGDED